MKNIPLPVWISLFALVGSVSCIEEYHPEIDTIPSHLVVEGLMTDIAGESFVKLRRSNMYGDNFWWHNESNAMVYVEDSDNNIIRFEEESPGNYLPAGNVVAEHGKTYVLSIITEDGNEYQSKPQEFPHNRRELLSVALESAVKDFYLHSSVSNRIYRFDVNGAMINATLSGSHKEYLRFNTTLTTQYIITHPGLVTDTYEYCWMNRNAGDYLDTRVGEMGGDYAPYLPIAFVPMQNKQLIYLGYPEGNYLNARIITKDAFFINDDTYRYYKQAEEQLGDNGRFFDPIATNPASNIENLTHPGQNPLGFFEASSMTRQLFNVRFDSRGNPDYFLIEDFDRIPPSGCSYEERPDFWQR